MHFSLDSVAHVMHIIPIEAAHRPMENEMQLKTVKTSADLPFKGVELIKTDSTITEVIIGGKLHIKAGQYSGIAVLVKSLGEEAKRVKITAKHDVFGDVVEFVEDGYAAGERVKDLEKAGADVTRETVSVVINDAGKVIAETGEPALQTADDHLPF